MYESVTGFMEHQCSVHPLCISLSLVSWNINVQSILCVSVCHWFHGTSMFSPSSVYQSVTGFMEHQCAVHPLCISLSLVSWNINVQSILCVSVCHWFHGTSMCSPSSVYQSVTGFMEHQCAVHPLCISLSLVSWNINVQSILCVSVCHWFHGTSMCSPSSATPTHSANWHTFTFWQHLVPNVDKCHQGQDRAGTVFCRVFPILQIGIIYRYINFLLLVAISCNG